MRAATSVSSARATALLGIPLVADVIVSRDDRAQAPPVIVINQAMAKQLWPR